MPLSVDVEPRSVVVELTLVVVISSIPVVIDQGGDVIVEPS